MNYALIDEIKRTDNIDEVNNLLLCGWRLVAICTTTAVSYVLGKLRSDVSITKELEIFETKKKDR